LAEEIEVVSSSDKNEDDLAALHAIIEMILENRDIKIPDEFLDKPIREIRKYL
jgi:hypothetical protein